MKAFHRAETMSLEVEAGAHHPGDQAWITAGLDWTARHGGKTLRLAGACALADVGGALIGLPERYWALVTAVVVTQPMLSDTLAAGRDRVTGTLVGAAAGFLVLEIAQHGAPIIPMFWIALVALSFLIAMRPYLRLSAVTLVVVVLVPGAGAPFDRPFDRVAEILLGTFASILIAALIRPKLWRRGLASPVQTTSEPET